MAEGRLAPAPISNQELNVSAPNYGADFLPYDINSIRDFILDKASSSEKIYDFGAVYKLHEHLKQLVSEETDAYERVGRLGHFASEYRSALNIPPKELTPGERSVQVTSGLFLSNVSSLTAMRTFIADRFWAPYRKVDDRSKKRYLEKRKIYQEDVDRYYDYFRDDLAIELLDDNLIDIANSARLLVSRRDWVSAITDTNNHEFVGSVLSERVVKQSLRSKFPQTRYGTAEEDSSPTKADIVVPLGESALHLQVKMKMREAEFKVRPGQTPMGVVVPMQVLRSQLSKPEQRLLIKAVSARAEELAA